MSAPLLRLLLAKDLNDRLTSPSQINSTHFQRNKLGPSAYETPQLSNIEHPLDTAISVRSIISLNQTKSLCVKRNSSTDSLGDANSTTKPRSRTKPGPSDEEADKKMNETEEAKSSDEDVIKIMSPVPQQAAADPNKPFEGFEWKTPRAEDPHWDDVNFVARSPKPVDTKKARFCLEFNLSMGKR